MTDELDLHVRHLIICREVLSDLFRRGEAYSLRNLVIHLQPNDEIGYPWTVESLVLFAQVFGDAGPFDFWVDLVFIEDDGTETPVANFGPLVRHVRPNQFVESVSFPLYNVSFPRPGIYEFQLRRDGATEPLASERLLLKD